MFIGFLLCELPFHVIVPFFYWILLKLNCSWFIKQGIIVTCILNHLISLYSILFRNFVSMLIIFTFFLSPCLVLVSVIIYLKCIGSWFSLFTYSIKYFVCWFFWRLDNIHLWAVWFQSLFCFIRREEKRNGTIFLL